MSTRGRPKKSDADRGGTTHVRVFEDIAEKVKWVAKALDVSQPQLLDPLLRDQIEAKYEKLRPLIEKMMAAAAEARRIEEDVQAKVKKRAKPGE